MHILEHQLAQYKRNRTGTITTNVSDLFDDNEDDKINIKRKFLYDNTLKLIENSFRYIS